jgi:hypothetical protein
VPREVNAREHHRFSALDVDLQEINRTRRVFSDDLIKSHHGHIDFLYDEVSMTQLGGLPWVRR